MGAKRSEILTYAQTQASSPEAIPPFRFEGDEAPEILVTDLSLLEFLLRQRIVVPFTQKPDEEES